MNSKWLRAAIPALLIHTSIGSVYCWSVVKQAIADDFGVGATTVEWAFSLAIFFLGMSAAFLGAMVEKNIKKSALVALICFVTGFAGTGLSIALGFLPGIFIFYGVIMGIGLGVGYLTPVKNLMLWFSKSKGLATGIAVAGFGLAKVIATPLMEALIGSVGLSNMFYVMAGIYGVAMFLGYLLIARPQGYVYDPKKSVVKKSTILKKPVFIGIWLMFYINITCGLALISQEKDILKGVLHTLNYSEAEIIGMVSLVLAVDAAFNTLGRLGFSTLSDHLKKRETAYKLIFAMSIVVCSLAMMSGAIEKAILPIVLAMLFLVNAGYGGGFSTLPVLLDQHFGMKTISTVHGMALSAWAMAGLSGNQMAAFIVHRLGLGYETVVVVITVMYCVALGISLYVSHVKSETEEVMTEPVVDIDCPIAPAH